MKKDLTIIVGVVLVFSIFIAYKPLKSPEPQKVITKEYIVSTYQGYVAGYVDEVIALHAYLITPEDQDFRGTVGVRNLPPCLDFKDVGVSKYSYPGATVFDIIVTLRLKEPGHCIMNKTYVVIWRNNITKKIPMGIIEFNILEASEEKTLTIPAYVEAFVGSNSLVPRLMYTISNPFEEAVEIVNVSFRVPGLRIVDFEPREIPPRGVVNFTVTLTNTTKLNNLYIIKPLIVYKVGKEEYRMPAPPCYYITLPGVEKS